MTNTPPPYQPAPQPMPASGAGAPKKGNGVAIAALIVGIVAFVGAFVPIVNYAAIVIALVGIVLGVIGLFIAARRGMAITGLVFSVVALIVSIILAVVYTFVFFGHVVTSIANSNGGGDGSGDEISVVYQVDGTGTDVTISYAAYDDGISVTKQETGESLPFEEDFEVSAGGANTYNTYTITATNGADGGDVICRIILDGKVLVEQESTGAYATASCTASGTQLLEG